ncbi:MAG: preprotein translocase subunit SecE [Clostridia bacterium]
MANNEEISQEVVVEETQQVSAENKKVEVKTEEKVAKKEEPKKTEKPKKKKKDKKQSKMAKRLKETSSELKKVTWPKFTTVLKQTGVVLAVTAAFLLVVFGIDRLCSWLVSFIV